MLRNYCFLKMEKHIITNHSAALWSYFTAYAQTAAAILKKLCYSAISFIIGKKGINYTESLSSIIYRHKTQAYLCNQLN